MIIQLLITLKTNYLDVSIDTNNFQPYPVGYFQKILNGFHSNESLLLQFLSFLGKNVFFFNFHQKVFFM